MPETSYNSPLLGNSALHRTLAILVTAQPDNLAIAPMR
jgi:hypothetical protein